MHSAKHFDPEIGIDIHIYIFPPLPAPVPLPTPHIGIVLDPFDYIPIIGGTIHVNGVKRATAGTGGLDVHIPMGLFHPAALPGAPMGPQVMGEELFMGSMTVVADGDPFSRIGMPVLDCNIVGLINPFRLKKPKKPQISMSLPTALNIAIPNSVFVGGPPMISIMGMLFKGLFAGLGKLVKLKAVQKLLNKGKDRWKGLFKGLPSSFLKCKILRAEPVDIRSGAVEVEHEDFQIPGRLPLVWTRRYRSDAIDAVGGFSACGPGWRTPADTSLEVDADGSVLFRAADGHLALFERLPLTGESDGQRAWMDGTLLTRKNASRGDELHVRTKEDLVHVFRMPSSAAARAAAGTLSLAIERLQDRHGNHWRFERADGRLVRIVESGVDGQQGRFLAVGEQAGRIHHLALHDPASGTTHPLVRYAYDAAGDLVAVHDALDAARRFEYRDHRLVRHIDRTGLSFFYTYDRRWRVVHAWGDHGLYDYKFVYNELLRETEVTDSLGHVSLVKFDANDLPLCEIDPLGGCTVFEYDDLGRTTAITDPASLRTEFAYDDRGNLVQLKRPDDSIIATAFNDDDKATTITDPSGAQWQQQWNHDGLLQMQITPLGAKSLFDYNAQGQLVRHTNPRGAATQLAFDRHGQLSKIASALGQETHFEHDALGRLLHRTDATGRRTRYDYDAKGRLLKATLPSGASVHCEYDAEDQLTRYVDENGAVTQLDYFGIGQIARRRQPDGHSVRYLYDTEEQLTAVINQRGETYALKRDALGRISEEIDYWGQGRRYQYDAAGRITKSIDPLGRVVGFTTDKLGRVTQKTLPDVANTSQQVIESFTYNKSGQLVELRNPASHVKRQFDAEGRLTEEEQNGFKIENQYDEVGNRTLRKTSAGNTVAVAYDLAEQAQQITINDETPILVTRNAMGQATGEQLSPHLSRQCEYNADGLLKRQSVSSDGLPLFDTRFDYDRGGNLTRRSDSQHGTDAYTYDPMGRILAHTDPTGQVKKYLNDPAGDRLKTRVQEVQLKQAVGGQQQPAMWTREGDLGDLHYTFDRAGNLISRRHGGEHDQPELQLEWDASQRLAKSQWQRGDRHGQVTTYAYDPLGRRVMKKNPTHTTWFFWDGDALMAEVKQANDPAPGPRDVKVVDFIAAKRRQEQMRLLHPQAREYIYRPGTFEPLALVDRQARVRLAEEPIQQLDPTQKHVLAATPPAADAPPDKSPTASLSSSLRGLGAGPGLGVAQAAPIADPGPPATTKPEAPLPTEHGLGLGTAGLGGGLSLVVNVPSSKAQAAPTPPHAAMPVEQAAPVQPQEPTPSVDSEVFYYFNDPNGCPTRLATPQGAVVWSARYTAWGQVAQLLVNMVEQPLRLQGQQEDVETGLHYNRHRYFDSCSGAYSSIDPLQIIAGENLFAFAPNVLTWTDALGLDEARFPGFMDTRQGYQRQHLIPYSSRNHALFQRSGMSINGASNMMYLPVAPGIDPNPLKGLHRGWTAEHSMYNDRVNRELDQLNALARNQKWDYRRVQQELVSLQTRLREGFHSGRFSCA